MPDTRSSNALAVYIEKNDREAWVKNHSWLSAVARGVKVV